MSRERPTLGAPELLTEICRARLGLRKFADRMKLLRAAEQGTESDKAKRTMLGRLPDGTWRVFAPGERLPAEVERATSVSELLCRVEAAESAVAQVRTY